MCRNPYPYHPQVFKESIFQLDYIWLQPASTCNQQWDTTYLQQKLVRAIQLTFCVVFYLNKKEDFGKSEFWSQGEKIYMYIVHVKPLLTGTGLFPVGKKRTERITILFDNCISMVSACPAWLQSHLLVANNNFIFVKIMCIHMYILL